MFLPRSVQVKSKDEGPKVSKESATLSVTEQREDKPVKKPSLESYPLPEVTDDVSEGSDSDEDPVVSYSKQQRWPQPDEPVCVMCGRYGAYIVDRTDRDVCSLECKARHLMKLGMPLYPMASGAAAAAAGVTSGSTADSGTNEGAESSGWSYREHPEVANLRMEEVVALRKKMTIKVEGGNVPKPISNLSHLMLPQKLLSNLEEQGYAVLTPVQMQVIPATLYQRDVLVCAATGSGKTLSFLLPIVLHLLKDARGVAKQQDSSHQQESGGRYPKSLILTPTRELAMQIEEQAKQLMKGLPQMRTGLVVGGMPVANQLHRLRSGVELVVATPARLNDILENHPSDVELADIAIFVLDEVDCLLSMGFESQVSKVLEMLPQCRQNLMFSATVPSSIARLARGMMRDPITVTIGQPGTPCEAIRHTIMWVEEASKKKKLLALLGDHRHFNPPVVIFVSSRKGCLLLADTINKSGIAAATAVGLHGDMAQQRRCEILQEFLEGKHSVLVATNVLGRGIDLISVSQVLIFDMPSSLLDFIHQVGRAGRLGSTGSAITFINNTSKNMFLSFVELMSRVGVALPPQLSNSPHLLLQKEQRKRSATASQTPGQSKRRKH